MDPSESPEKHWNRIYETRGPTSVSWYEADPSESMDAIRRSGLAPGSRVVDVGCGESLLVDALLTEGYAPTLLDVSSAAIEDSKKRLGDRSGQVTWVVSDVASWSPSEKVDCWHDRAVFHFMVTAEDRQKYVTTLRRALRTGGVAIIATFAPEGPERCSGLPVQRYSGTQLAAALGPEFALLDERAVVHVTPSGAPQAFTVARFSKVA